MASQRPLAPREGGMQAHMRNGRRRSDLCSVFVFFVFLAVISSIAYVWLPPLANFVVISDSFVAEMRFLASILVPLLAPVAPTGNGHGATNSTKYAVKTPPLTTPWTYNISTNPWPEYPRPQLQRSDWLNLNGIWTYQNASSLDAVNSPPFGQTLANEVLVPSCLESGLSGMFAPLSLAFGAMLTATYRNPRNLHALLMVFDLFHYPFVLVWPTNFIQFWRGRL